MGMYSGRLTELAGLDELFQSILSLQDTDECFRLFDDLCTVGELKAMGQRYQVACLLQKGARYEDIERITGASSATISRVKRFVEYGSGGYKMIYARSRKQEPGEQSPPE
jgi:TrpR-related protein YerC/YecD